MMGAIVKKEILKNLTSYKFTIIVILSTVLILTSIFLMYRDYLLRLENYGMLQPESTEATAIVKPTPLSIFAKGLDENLCRSYSIRFGGQIAVGSGQQSVNSLFRLFTTPDLLYVIKVIMALCAMLFAFDMISSEKANGTLGLSLANSIKRPIVILGKWLGGFASLIIPFFLAVLLATFLVNLSAQIQLSGSDWGKIIVFLLSAVLYMAVFFSLGLLISTLSHRSSSSLVICLFLWALLIFVLPNLGNILAKQFVDVPSVQQLEVRRQHIWIKEVFERIQGLKDGREMQNNINQENDKLMADYRAQFNRLVFLSQNITRLSPAAAFTYFATDLAGTGIAEERKMKQEVLQYKNQVWNKQSDSDGNLLGDMPVFSYKRSSISQTLTWSSLSNLLIIVIFNLLFFSAAYVAFLRYDVR